MPRRSSPCRATERRWAKFHARQHDDEGAPQEPQGDRRRLAGGWFHPAISASATGRLHRAQGTARRTSSSGGENISTIEVESVIYRTRRARMRRRGAPREKWGRDPCAFVALKEGDRRPRATSSPLPRAARAFQMPEDRDLRRAAQDLDRQGAESRTAREGEGELSAAPVSAPLDLSTSSQQIVSSGFRLLGNRVSARSRAPASCRRGNFPPLSEIAPRLAWPEARFIDRFSRAPSRC